MPLFFGPVLSVNQSDGGFGNGLINPIRFSKNERLNITKDGTTKRAMNKRLTSFMVAALHGKAVFVFLQSSERIYVGRKCAQLFQQVFKVPESAAGLGAISGQTMARALL